MKIRFDRRLVFYYAADCGPEKLGRGSTLGVRSQCNFVTLWAT